MVEQVISDTEAREHFDEVMRRVVESNQAVIVEQDGTRQVVVLPVTEYERMRGNPGTRSTRGALRKLLELGDEITAERGGVPLPPADDIIHEMREERDADIDRSLGVR